MYREEENMWMTGYIEPAPDYMWRTMLKDACITPLALMFGTIAVMMLCLNLGETIRTPIYLICFVVVGLSCIAYIHFLFRTFFSKKITIFELIIFAFLPITLCALQISLLY